MSISKTILIGNLGKNPEIRSTQSGQMVANFSLATSKKWKDKNTGEKKEKTAWHNIVCFGKLVNVCEYLEKGSVVYVEGELEYGEYTNEADQKVKTTTINANVIDIIKGKNRESISQHSVDKGNGYQPQEEIIDDSCPF